VLSDEGDLGAIAIVLQPDVFAVFPADAFPEPMQSTFKECERLAT